MKTIKTTNYVKNYSSELLSKAVDTMILSNDNVLLNLLVEAVAIVPLNIIEFGRLSIAALQYLLSCTHEKKSPLQLQISIPYVQIKLINNKSYL